jgi:hypothetical protein
MPVYFPISEHSGGKDTLDSVWPVHLCVICMWESLSTPHFSLSVSHTYTHTRNQEMSTLARSVLPLLAGFSCEKLSTSIKREKEKKFRDKQNKLDKQDMKGISL